MRTASDFFLACFAELFFFTIDNSL